MKRRRRPKLTSSIGSTMPSPARMIGINATLEDNFWPVVVVIGVLISTVFVSSLLVAS